MRLLALGSSLALALTACADAATHTFTSAASTDDGARTSGQGGAGGLALGGGGAGGASSGGASSFGGAVPATAVRVVITADNAYSFGYGDAAGITHFTQGARAQTAGQIFNCGEGPEEYVVPASDAPPSAYLYVVTWDDLSVTQGVLGQFARAGASPLYTGDARFEACATGIDMSASDTGPTQADINAQITLCNAGSGDPATTSAGWVDGNGAVTKGAIGTLAVGEANDPQVGGTFPPVCPTGVAPAGVPSIDPAARWMWYQPGGVADPFQSTGANTFRAYLIFRVAAHELPPVPS